MIFNIISDIHGNIDYNKFKYSKNIIPSYSNFFNVKNIKKSDVLLIAGDLGLDCISEFYVLKQIKNWCFKNNQKYIIISGNHSFYNNVYSNDTFINVYNMDYDYVVKYINPYDECHMKIEKINNYLIISSTLWTPILSDKSKYYCSRYMNDYRLIKNPIINKLFTCNDSTDIFYKHLNFIKNKINEYSNDSSIEKIIIMTHHLPLKEVISNKYVSSDVNAAYCPIDDKKSNKEILNLIKNNKKIKLWVHGHSHDKLEKEIYQCKVIRNPLGYGRKLYNERSFKKEDFNNLIEI